MGEERACAGSGRRDRVREEVRVDVLDEAVRAEADRSGAGDVVVLLEVVAETAADASPRSLLRRMMANRRRAARITTEEEAALGSGAALAVERVDGPEASAGKSGVLQVVPSPSGATLVAGDEQADRRGIGGVRRAVGPAEARAGAVGETVAALCAEADAEAGPRSMSN